MGEYVFMVLREYPIITLPYLRKSSTTLVLCYTTRHEKKIFFSFRKKTWILHDLICGVCLWILEFKPNLIIVGGKDLNFYVGPQAPITNKNTSDEEKMFRKAP